MEKVKGPTDEDAIKNRSAKRTEPNFDKPLGSSHNDKLDVRGVADKAAKRSQ